jgi:hypothetical protein
MLVKFTLQQVGTYREPRLYALNVFADGFTPTIEASTSRLCNPSARFLARCG